MTRPPRALLLGSIAALTAVVLVCVGQHVWPQALVEISGSIADGPRSSSRFGWGGFLLIQVVVAISGFLPASLVGVSAGAAYGVTFGFATASISTLTGALVAFLVSRSLLRPVIEQKLRNRPHLASLDGDIGNRGWRVVCLLRLSPVMPFAATSYMLGLSSIALGDYMIGTLASLPALLAYVLVGALVKTGLSAWSDGQNLIRLASLGIGMLSMVILLIGANRMLRRVGLAPRQWCHVTRASNRLIIREYALLFSRDRSFAPPMKAPPGPYTEAPGPLARPNQHG